MRKLFLTIMGVVLMSPLVVKADEICTSYANMLIALNMEMQEVLSVTPPDQVAAVKQSYQLKINRLRREMETLGCFTGGDGLTCEDLGMVGTYPNCTPVTEPPTPTPTPDPTIDPTPTPTPNPTVDPTPTPTPNPTVDPTPTPTPNPTVDPTSTPPTPTPTPTPVVDDPDDDDDDDGEDPSNVCQELKEQILAGKERILATDPACVSGRRGECQKKVQDYLKAQMREYFAKGCQKGGGWGCIHSGHDRCHGHHHGHGCKKHHHDSKKCGKR